jgi:hypothetical protein
MLHVTLAAVPDRPTTGPISDATVTNDNQIKVTFGPLLDTQNGGSPVLSYDLQIDDGIGGLFTSLIGEAEFNLDTTFTISKNITSGGIYRFTYRAKNVNGWSPFSPVTNIKAATRPQRPPAPTFQSATSTSVTINMFRSSEDGGDLIINYQLWRNAGGSSTTYVQVTSYNGVSMSCTLSVAADSLTSGTIYKFMTVATNAFGSSDYSDELNVGVSSFPAKPSPVTQVVTESG